MKNHYQHIILLITGSLFFFSCKSIPAPAKNNNCMLYCQLHTNIFTNISIDEVDINKQSPMELRFRNIKTNKFIILKKGWADEYYATNIPQGTYIFHSFKTCSYLKDGSTIPYVLKLNKNKTTNFHFIPVNNSVINLGIIKVDYKYMSSSDTSWNIYWDEEQETAYEKFKRYHPDSPWLKKEWITRHESLERNLTLFP